MFNPADTRIAARGMELCAPVRGAAELISRWAFGCRRVGSRPFKAGNRLLGGGGGTAHPWLSPRAGLCLRPHTAEGGAWTRSVLSSRNGRLDPSARPGAVPSAGL